MANREQTPKTRSHPRFAPRRDAGRPKEDTQPPPNGAEPAEAPPKPPLLDRVRQAIRVRHYSPLTEKAYVGWIKRFIFFFDKRHPGQMGEPEISAFVSHLATRKNVSASTQNQALSALFFLYRQ